MWVQVGSEERFKLVKLGVLRLMSKYGFSFEAKREPAPGEFDMYCIHVCRAGPCGFRGDRNHQNKVKDRHHLHITKLAYSDDFNSVPDGGLGVVGVPAVDVIARKYWKISLGVLVMTSVVMDGAKFRLSEMSFSSFPYGLLSPGILFFDGQRPAAGYLRSERVF